MAGRGDYGKSAVEAKSGGRGSEQEDMKGMKDMRGEISS
jgi:hypothetical protein